jgi:inorganic phosphate transporter, PiT family
MFGFSNLIYYIGSLFLGWGLGANDSANIFGTAVSSKMVKFRVAAFCTAGFVILGAVVQGRAGIETLAYSLNQKASQVDSSILPQNKSNGLIYKKELHTQQKTYNGNGYQAKSIIKEMKKDEPLKEAMIMSLAAAVAVFFMTLRKLPVSTSQAIVGAIIGLGIIKNDVNIQGLEKVVLCWIGTPVGGMIFTVIFYFIFKKIFNLLQLSVLQYDYVIRILLVLAGCYGAYALGANNVANVTAVFVTSGSLTVNQAAWFGGIAIAFGVITYSKPVMVTIGCDIVKLDAFMAFITVLSLSVTVYIYALIGVPVSTTQAIVGAVFGISLIKGTQTVNFGTLRKIAAAWIITPIIGGVLGAFGYFISNLYYII